MRATWLAALAFVLSSGAFGQVTSLSQQPLGAPIPGVAGAIWADLDNDGFVDGYLQNGRYYSGAPAGFQVRVLSRVEVDAPDIRAWKILSDLAGRGFVDHYGNALEYRWVERGAILQKIHKTHVAISLVQEFYLRNGRVFECHNHGTSCEDNPVELSGTLVQEDQFTSTIFNDGKLYERSMGEVRRFDEVPPAKLLEISASRHEASDQEQEDYSRQYMAEFEEQYERQNHGPTAYDVLRGMADAAGEAAHNSQRELNQTIASARGRPGSPDGRTYGSSGQVSSKSGGTQQPVRDPSEPKQTSASSRFGYCWYQTDGAPNYVSQYGSVGPADTSEHSSVVAAWQEYLDRQGVLDKKRLQWWDGLPPRLPTCMAMKKDSVWSTSPTYLDFVPGN